MENPRTEEIKHFASDGLPLFLGDPYAKPEPILPDPPWFYILAAVGLIGDKYPGLSPVPEDYQLQQLLECDSVLLQEDFERLFLKWKKNQNFWGFFFKIVWAGLVAYLRGSEGAENFKVQTPKDDQDDPYKKLDDQVYPGREIKGQPTGMEGLKNQPFPTSPDLKNLPSFAQVKHYALVRKTTVFDFIFEQSRSLSFAKVHGFIQHHGNFKLSSPGKIVYNGSFAWVARDLGIHRDTVWRAFHWMAERKLVTKIGDQDHRKKRNSRWYVCTSMAQNLKIWSLGFQGQKGKKF